MLPRKTQRTEPRRDDDVDLPACVLPCEVTREYLRLSRTRESLALDGLLVELDVRGVVSAQARRRTPRRTGCEEPRLHQPIVEAGVPVCVSGGVCARQPAISTGDDNEAADAGDDRGASSSLHGRTDVQGSRRRLYASRATQGIVKNSAQLVGANANAVSEDCVRVQGARSYLPSSTTRAARRFNRRVSSFELSYLGRVFP